MMLRLLCSKFLRLTGNFPYLLGSIQLLRTGIEGEDGAHGSVYREIGN